MNLRAGSLQNGVLLEVSEGVVKITVGGCNRYGLLMCPLREIEKIRRGMELSESKSWACQSEGNKRDETSMFCRKAEPTAIIIINVLETVVGLGHGVQFHKRTA